MPRITISVESETPVEQDLVTLDLDLSLSLAELKSLVQHDINVSPASQHYYLDGRLLHNDSKSLSEHGIKDGEMLSLAVREPRNPPQNPNTNHPVSKDRDLPENIENMRQHILKEPGQVQNLHKSAPDLAKVLNDPQRFKEIWLKRVEREEEQQRQHNDEMRRLNNDPFDLDAQRKIADIIRRENIERNLQYAYEHNPEAFTQVHMLYVPILVNGHPVKAFVDSGAQTTIMSPSCADSCGLSNLIDERYSGVARGVGTAKIIGKVHHAKIQVGDAELDCAFTVMEGKDVDLLFGLDMLKRHQACIDLKSNKLKFAHTEVEFLPENQIPRAEEKKMLAEPTVEGPGGTEIGAKTGTIRPQGTSAAAHEQLKQLHQERLNRKQDTSTSASASASASASISTSLSQLTNNPAFQRPSFNPPQPVTAPTQATATPIYTESALNQLVALGFERSAAIQALEATGGNVEYAAGLLFTR